MTIRIRVVRGTGPREAIPGLRQGSGRPAGLVAGGFLGRVLAVAAGAVVLVAGLFVSAVLFSVLLVVGVVAGGWFWWRTRDLRKQLAERMAQMQQMQTGQMHTGRATAPGRRAGADVIDGDFIREADAPGAGIPDPAARKP